MLCRRYTGRPGARARAGSTRWCADDELEADRRRAGRARSLALSPRYLEIAKISSNVWWNPVRDSLPARARHAGPGHRLARHDRGRARRSWRSGRRSSKGVARDRGASRHEAVRLPRRPGRPRCSSWMRRTSRSSARRRSSRGASSRSPRSRRVGRSALRRAGAAARERPVPADGPGRARRPIGAHRPARDLRRREALMAASSHADSMFAMQGIGSYAITPRAAPTQRAAVAAARRAGEALAALGAHRARRRLRPQGRSPRHRRATGGELGRRRHKSFISNAGAAALLHGPGPRGRRLLAGARAGGRGRRHGRAPAPAHRAARAGRRVLDGRAAAARTRLGEPGKGFDLVLVDAGGVPGLGRRRGGRSRPGGARGGRRATRDPRAVRAAAGPARRRWPPCSRTAGPTSRWRGCSRIAPPSGRAATRGRTAPIVDGKARRDRDGRPRRRPLRAGHGPLRPRPRVARSSASTAQARPMRIYEGASEVLRLGIATRNSRKRCLMDLGLEGPVAIVTGAGRGLGRAIALALAAEGARVLAVARSTGELDGAQGRGSRARSRSMHCDMLRRERRRGACRTRRCDAFGRLDIVVNNAGIAPAGEFIERTDERMAARASRSTYCAPVVLARAAGAPLLAQGRGKVINVASTSGIRGKPMLVAYSASKGAIVQFTKALAAEWAGRGVQVNAVAPGAFATDAQRAVLESPDLLARRDAQDPGAPHGPAPRRSARSSATSRPAVRLRDRERLRHRRRRIQQALENAYEASVRARPSRHAARTRLRRRLRAPAAESAAAKFSARCTIACSTAGSRDDARRHRARLRACRRATCSTTFRARRRSSSSTSPKSHAASASASTGSAPRTRSGRSRCSRTCSSAAGRCPSPRSDSCSSASASRCTTRTSTARSRRSTASARTTCAACSSRCPAEPRARATPPRSTYACSSACARRNTSTSGSRPSTRAACSMPR